MKIILDGYQKYRVTPKIHAENFWVVNVMLQIIINAINNRELVAFTYIGISRVAQPAAVGISPAGNNVMRCYQTQGGHVTSGRSWDLCEISKIINLRLTGQNFAGEPPGYKRHDKGMIRIFAQL